MVDGGNEGLSGRGRLLATMSSGVPCCICSGRGRVAPNHTGIIPPATIKGDPALRNAAFELTSQA
jgi:hypothetical protein